MNAYNQETNIPYGGAGIVRKLSGKNCTIQQDKISPFLQIGRDDVSPSFVLIGDSHSMMSYPGIDVVCKEENISGVLMNTLLLPFWNEEYGSPKDSYAINQHKTQDFMKWLEKHDELHSVVVIFSWYWATNMLNCTSSDIADPIAIQKNMASMEAWLSELKKRNKEAIVFLPYPRFKSNNMLMYARHRARRELTNTPMHSDFIVTHEDYQKQWGSCIHALRTFESKGLCHVLDPSPHLFSNKECHAIHGNNIIFFDCNHISADSSINVAKALQKDIARLLKK